MDCVTTYSRENGMTLMLPILLVVTLCFMSACVVSKKIRFSCKNQSKYRCLYHLIGNCVSLSMLFEQSLQVCVVFWLVNMIIALLDNIYITIYCIIADLQKLIGLKRTFFFNLGTSFWKNNGMFWLLWRRWSKQTCWWWWTLCSKKFCR